MVYNKKGQFFLPLFVLITLITLTMLYLALQDRRSDVVGEGLLGSKQLSLIQAESAADRALLYLDLSASLAFTDAFTTVLTHDGLTSPFLQGDCVYRGVRVYGRGCVADDYLSTFSVAYQQSLDDYLLWYHDSLYPAFAFPRQNYVFQMRGKNVYGYAQEPLVFTVKS